MTEPPDIEAALADLQKREVIARIISSLLLIYNSSSPGIVNMQPLDAVSTRNLMQSLSFYTARNSFFNSLRDHGLDVRQAASSENSLDSQQAGV